MLARSLLSRFEQEPGPSLSLIDPILDQAGRGDVVALVTNLVGGAQKFYQLLVIFHQFSQHLFWTDKLGIVILQPLMFGNIGNRSQRSPADFASAFRDVVGHSENLFALLVQQEVIVTEMRPAHVPMEILRLNIEREYVGQQMAKGARDLIYPVMIKIGRGS